MPLVNQFGLTFNCGFCRTFVYECLYTSKKSLKTDNKEKLRGHQESSCEQPSSNGVHPNAEEPNESGHCKIQVRPKIQDFELVFVGPGFCVKEGYFDKSSKGCPSLFDAHCKRVMKAWVSIPNSELRQNYLATFSLKKWDSLSAKEKGTQSLSNCHACANTFDSIQRTFPLKPYFQPTSILTEASSIENEYPKFNEKCKKLIGKSFPEVAASNAKKLGLRDINGEVQKAIRDTKHECTAECNATLEKSTLQAAYCTDLSFSRLQRYRKHNIMSLQMNQVKTSNSSLKTRGGAAPALELLGVFVRFRRTFAKVITFGGASVHEF